MLEKTAMQYPTTPNRELDTKHLITVADTQSVLVDTHISRYTSTEGTENTGSHRISVFFHNLKKYISLIEHLGDGRIDEQRLTTRDPWLEVFRFRKDL